MNDQTPMSTTEVQGFFTKGWEALGGKSDEGIARYDEWLQAQLDEARQQALLEAAMIAEMNAQSLQHIEGDIRELLASDPAYRTPVSEDELRAGLAAFVRSRHGLSDG